MLSILIPTYNYNIVSLVQELHKQSSILSIEYEIIVVDDCSSKFITENKTIQNLSNTNYYFLEKNIGRSKIRNLLATKATYNWLLFLDADVLPNSEYFISNYCNEISNDSDEKTIYGGICYTTIQPSKEFIFRWKYGNLREAKSLKIRNKNQYLSFLTLNFLIHKNIFKTVQFNESVPNLRHEDTLFSYDLKRKSILVKHVDNTVIHLGLDTFETAIRKENESLQALIYMLNNNLIKINYLKISRAYNFICKLKFDSFISKLFQVFKVKILTNLKSNNPNLLVFDLYRLGYLCELRAK